MGVLRELAGFTFHGHGEPVNLVFAVACTCGVSSFTVVGHIDEDDEATPPITLECAGCEAEHTIFDAGRHGYNGALFGDDFEPAGEPGELWVEEVEPPHEVRVRLEYPSDVLGDEGFEGKEHDHFSWVTIVGRKPGGAPATLFDYECS